MREVRNNHRGFAEDQIAHLNDDTLYDTTDTLKKQKTYANSLARIHDRLDVIASTINATRIRENQFHLLKSMSEINQLLRFGLALLPLRTSSASMRDSYWWSRQC